MKKLLFLLAFASGAAWAQNTNCDHALISTVQFTGTSGVAIPVVGYQKIRVCKVYLTTSAATSLALVNGTTSTAVSGTIQGVAFWQAEHVDGAMRTNPGEALTITAGTSVTVSGSLVYYREQP